MTPEQQQLARAARIIGQRFGVGGGTWVYAPPRAGDNVVTEAGDPASDGTRAAYVVREQRIIRGTAAPLQPVAVDRWRLIAEAGADIATGGTLVAGDLAFRVGPVTTEQGYLDGIVEPTAAPDLATAPRRGIRMGLRIGAR